MSAPKTEKTQTIEMHARDLCNMAQLTAKHSQNWENFEQIALAMLRQTFEAGYQSAHDYTRAPENQPENIR